jgi:hypothetical protein
MSQPFSDQPGAAPMGGHAAPAGYGQGPFAPPPQKSRFWTWLLGGCGCSAVLLLLCCGGFAYWGYTVGQQGLATLIRQEVADNAEVKEHLGEINSLSTDFIESAQEKQNRGGNSNWLVFHAEGTKGKGKFIGELSGQPKAGGTFTSIELRLPDGKTIPIK